jgi:hypothetical protein
MPVLITDFYKQGHSMDEWPYQIREPRLRATWCYTRFERPLYLWHKFKIAASDLRWDFVYWWCYWLFWPIEGERVRLSNIFFSVKHPYSADLVLKAINEGRMFSSPLDVRRYFARWVIKYKFGIPC